MKEASPVKNATASNSCTPPSARDAGATGEKRTGRASSATATAITRFIAPATRSVPGKPTAAISTKPLTSTPAAAPRLLVK